MADNQNWLTLNRYDGPSGTTQVTISAETCPDKTSRVATITFRAGNLVKRLKVTQGASYSAQIGISCSSYSVYVGTPVTFTVKVSNADEYANYRWVVTVVGSGTTAGGGYTITPSDLSGNTAQKSFQLTNNTENSTKLTLMATLYDNAGEVIANSDAKTFYFYRNQQQDPKIQLIWQSEIYPTKNIEVNREYNLKVIMSGVGTNRLKYSASTDTTLVTVSPQGFVETMGETIIKIRNNNFISVNDQDVCTVRVDLYDGNEHVSGPNGFSIVTDLKGVRPSSEGKITIVPSTQQVLNTIGQSIVYTATCDYDVNTLGFRFVRNYRRTEYTQYVSWDTGKTSNYGVIPATYTGVATYVTELPEPSVLFEISASTTAKTNNEYIYTATTAGLLVEKSATKLTVIWDDPDRSKPAKLTVHYHSTRPDDTQEYKVWWKQYVPGSCEHQSDWTVDECDGSATTSNNYLTLTRTEMPANIGTNYFFKVQAIKKPSSQYDDSEITSADNTGWALGLGDIGAALYISEQSSYVFASAISDSYTIDTLGEQLYLRLKVNIPCLIRNSLFKSCNNYDFSAIPSSINYFYFPGQDSGGIISNGQLPATKQVVKRYDYENTTTCNCMYFVSGTTFNVGGVQAATGDLVIYAGSDGSDNKWVVVKRNCHDSQPLSENYFDFMLQIPANESRDNYTFYFGGNGSIDDGWYNNMGGLIEFIQFKKEYYLRWSYNSKVYLDYELNLKTHPIPGGVSDIDSYTGSNQYTISFPSDFTLLDGNNGSGYLLVQSNFPWYVAEDEKGIISNHIITLLDRNNNQLPQFNSGTTEVHISAIERYGDSDIWGGFTLTPVYDQLPDLDGSSNELERPIHVVREVKPYVPSSFYVTINGIMYSGSTDETIRFVFPQSGTGEDLLTMYVTTPNGESASFVSNDSNMFTGQNQGGNVFKVGVTPSQQPTTKRDKWFGASVTLPGGGVSATHYVKIYCIQEGTVEFPVSPTNFPQSEESQEIQISSPTSGAFTAWYLKYVKNARGEDVDTYNPVSLEQPYISTQSVNNPSSYIPIGSGVTQNFGTFYVHTELMQQGEFTFGLAAIQPGGTGGEIIVEITMQA